MINIIRNIFGSNYTSGDLYLQGERFCYTLEDTLRADGIKIKDKTAFSDGVYIGKITYSPKYKKDMILIYNQSDYSLISNGIKFTGLRIHGGNDVDDTSGCVLAAYNRISNSVIQGRASDDLLDRIRELYGETEFIIVVSSDTKY